MAEANRMYWGLKELRMLMDEEVTLDRIKEKVDKLTDMALGCQCSERYNYVVSDQKLMIMPNGDYYNRLYTDDMKCRWVVDLHYRPSSSKIVRVEARREGCQYQQETS